MARVRSLAFIAGLLLELYGLTAEATGVSTDVDCLVVNLEYVHCSWNKQGTPEVNYTFYSGFNKDISECTTYLSENNINTGCKQPYGEILNRFRTFHTRLVHGNNVFSKELDLKAKVKLNPPTNLTVENGADSNLWSRWNQTFAKCVESEVRYRFNNNKWETSKVSIGQQSYFINLPSSTSTFELQVRSRVGDNCGESLFWSDWSEPVVWGSSYGTGALFVSQQAANAVLIRRRRYNSGHLEEIHKDNLERECIEEVCTMEEAREVFENDEKTMEFWAGYMDGNQCDPPPCQNGGVCEDGMSTYVCYCKPNFSGKNCEIEVTKQCSVNNGECSHFCVMQAVRAVCKCAAGYQLGSDKRSCEPTEQFSCGRVDMSSTSSTGAIIKPRSSNSSEKKHNSSDTLQDYYNNINVTDIYDYYDFSMNDSDPLNISVATGVDIRSVQSDSSSSVNPTEVVMNSAEANSVTETLAEKEQLPSWAFFPTVPTITAEENSDQRIVGGNEAKPGEIPWQVTLMYRTPTLERALSLCGGSLLSELWVITAAHCLVQADITKRHIFVRVGEHDLNKDEGPERDHEVAERHIHRLYNYTKSPYNHDIALLKLASPVELSNQRRPICLGPKDFTESLMRDTSGSLVSGWGLVNFGGIEATKLKKVQVPYVDRTQCKQSSKDHITQFMFCAGYKSERMDSCQGDSGGPHATNYKGTWFLTGVVSWGEECAKEGKYGIYTRISRYYRWISQETGIHVTN